MQKTPQSEAQRRRRILELADELDVALKSNGPLMRLLVMARARSLDAMEKLVFIDSHNAAEIHKKQLDAMLFRLYVEDLRVVLQEADEVTQAITREEREEIEELVRSEAGDLSVMIAGTPD